MCKWPNFNLFIKSRELMETRIWNNHPPSKFETSKYYCKITKHNHFKDHAKMSSGPHTQHQTPYYTPQTVPIVTKPQHYLFPKNITTYLTTSKAFLTQSHTQSYYTPLILHLLKFSAHHTVKRADDIVWKLGNW